MTGPTLDHLAAWEFFVKQCKPRYICPSAADAVLLASWNDQGATTADVEAVILANRAVVGRLSYFVEPMRVLLEKRRILQDATDHDTDPDMITLPPFKEGER